MSSKMRIALVIGGLIAAGVLALVGGWMARSWSDSHHPPPAVTTAETHTVTPHPSLIATTAGPPVTATPVPVLTVPPTLPTADEPRATATLRPTPIASPTPGEIVVGPNEGLYAVCRRYCPGRWGENEISPELIDYAHQVAELNDLRLENGQPWDPRTSSKDPIMYGGERLKMPPCPSQ